MIREVNVLDAWGQDPIRNNDILRCNIIKSPKATQPKLNYSNFGLGSILVVESLNEDLLGVGLCRFAGRIALITEPSDMLEIDVSLSELVIGSPGEGLVLPKIYQGHAKIFFEKSNRLIEDLDRYEELQSMHLGFS